MQLSLGSSVITDATPLPLYYCCMSNASLQVCLLAARLLATFSCQAWKLLCGEMLLVVAAVLFFKVDAIPALNSADDSSPASRDVRSNSVVDQSLLDSKLS